MKVIFLQNQNEKLQDILDKLKVEVLIAENKPSEFIEEWQTDNNVKVFKCNEFSPEVDHICKGLNLYTDAYEYISDNFTQNQMNNLTFSEVEYVKSLKNNDDRVDVYQQMINRIAAPERFRTVWLGSNDDTEKRGDN